jgi:hypothetical protein
MSNCNNDRQMILNFAPGNEEQAERIKRKIHKLK